MDVRVCFQLQVQPFCWRIPDSRKPGLGFLRCISSIVLAKVSAHVIWDHGTSSDLATPFGASCGSSWASSRVLFVAIGSARTFHVCAKQQSRWLMAIPLAGASLNRTVSGHAAPFDSLMSEFSHLDTANFQTFSEFHSKFGNYGSIERWY